MSSSARVECWVWYGLAISSVIIRYLSQYIIRKRNFFRDVPVDDILMLFLTLIYTTGIVALYTYFDIMVDTDFENITPEDAASVGRTLGVYNILAETAIQTTLWGNKCCLLLLYNRLVLFGHQVTLWIIVAAYTGLTYVAVIVALYGGWCRPFSDYLVLVPGNMECLTWKHYNIMQLTMNLSTDLILLLIPVTLISRLNMKIGRKLLLMCLFSMGVFVMLSAILMKVTVFSNSVDPVWFSWSVREISTAMLVGNLVLGFPLLKAGWRLIFPSSGSTKGGSSAASGSGATKKSMRSSGGTTSTEPGSSSRWESPSRAGEEGAGEGAGRSHDVELYGKDSVRDASRRLSVGQESV
ncbi:hypothetical protein CCHL11_08672 [Colletotrichum chlorophyti]|uniref:Rhodopsin domain-containing protein n=1 Tax=Colletotrichum chlorophyti TaxID=708187 RepID=A0A1Q8RCD1_9PEZI|nr:hypothetical protein CCHL11_08672 [Colletotrichum chlorophyti]